MRKFILAIVAAAALGPVVAPAIANAQPVPVAAARHEVARDRAEVRHDHREIAVARAHGDYRRAHIARHELRHDRRELRRDHRVLHRKMMHHRHHRHHDYRR